MQEGQGSIKYYETCMGIQTSTTGYVTIKRWDLFKEKAVPTGKVREVEGTREAEFFLISSPSVERKIWLRREEIYQE